MSSENLVRSINDSEAMSKQIPDIKESLIGEAEGKKKLVAQTLMSLKGLPGLPVEAANLEDQKRLGYFARDFGIEKWDWPQGIGLLGLGAAGEDYFFFIDDWFRQRLSEGLPVANINTVCPLRAAVDREDLQSLTRSWANKIFVDFNRTDEGALQHDTTGDTPEELKIHPEQIWADTVYMTVQFLAQMGVRDHNSEWSEEAEYQVLVHIKYLLDRPTGLFYHGWDFSTRHNFGGNFWCRGNSWMTMGLAEYLSLPGLELTASVRRFIDGTYQNQARTLLALQDQETGLWHTLLDDPSSYVESSGSAGIVAGILMGMNENLLDEDALSAALGEPVQNRILLAIEGLLAQINSDGMINNVSAGTPLSVEADDYRNIIHGPLPFGHAMVLLAITQFLRWSQRSA